MSLIPNLIKKKRSIPIIQKENVFKLERRKKELKLIPFNVSAQITIEGCSVIVLNTPGGEYAIAPMEFLELLGGMSLMAYKAISHNYENGVLEIPPSSNPD